MTPDEVALLEALHGYQKHLGDQLVMCLAELTESSKQNEQAALAVTEATRRLGAMFDRIDAMEKRLGAYITDQAKHDSGVRTVDARLKQHLAEDHGQR